MSKHCFNAITREIRFTNTKLPPYVDNFCQIIQMLKSWKDHMTSILLASWEIRLYKSMYIWNSRWKCPGWVFCPRNTHTFGNEWHAYCCAFSGILFGVELVEGKAHPCQAVSLEFKDLDRNTVELLLRMMRRYFATGDNALYLKNFFNHINMSLNAVTRLIEDLVPDYHSIKIHSDFEEYFVPDSEHPY